MFFEALDKLTPDDIRQLAAKGVDRSRVSDWRARRRVPTRPQAYALAHVAGIDFDALERELTVIEIEQDAQKNSGFKSLLPALRRQWQHS
jgi:transcriptional regulator with XRE-family HTH domain